MQNTARPLTTVDEQTTTQQQQQSASSIVVKLRQRVLTRKPTLSLSTQQVYATNTSAPIAIAVTSQQSSSSLFAEFIDTQQLIDALNVGRDSALRDLIDSGMKTLLFYDFHELWPAIQDLNVELVLEFIRVICEQHFDNLHMFRFTLMYFCMRAEVIKLQQCAYAISALIRNGRQIEPFESHILQTLMQFPTADVLPLLANILKFNHASLDSELIVSLLKSLSPLTNDLKFLEFYDTIIRFGAVPHNGVVEVCRLLGRLVNIEIYCVKAWQVVHIMLRSKQSATTLACLVAMMTEKVDVTHGAIFCLGMAVWGAERVETLLAPFTTLLRKFLVCVETRLDVLLDQEILLSLQSLLFKFGSSLTPVEWDLILAILDILSRYQNTSAAQPRITALLELMSQVWQVIIGLMKQEKFYGDFESTLHFLANSDIASEQNRLYIVEQLLVVEWLQHQSDDWMDELQIIIEKYLRQNQSKAVRSTVIKLLRERLFAVRYFDIAKHYVDTLLLPSLHGIMMQSTDASEIWQAALIYLEALTEDCVSYDDIFKSIEVAIKHKATDEIAIVICSTLTAVVLFTFRHSFRVRNEELAVYCMDLMNELLGDDQFTIT